MPVISETPEWRLRLLPWASSFEFVVRHEVSGSHNWRTVGPRITNFYTDMQTDLYYTVTPDVVCGRKQSRKTRPRQISSECFNPESKFFYVFIDCRLPHKSVRYDVTGSFRSATKWIRILAISAKMMHVARVSKATNLKPNTLANCSMFYLFSLFNSW